MELRQLRYFAVVGREENFNRASEKLNIVQPALTRQVKQLEEELGFELFERIKRRVRLTDAGRSFLLETEHILSEIDKSIRRTRLVAEGKTGTLKIGYSESAAYGEYFPHILQKFRQKFPDVSVEMIPDSSVPLEEQLNDHLLDIVFVYHRPRRFRHFQYLRLDKEQIVLAAPADHELTSKQPLSLNDLHGMEFVWLKRTLSPSYYDDVIAACQKQGLTLNVVQESDKDSVMLSLVGLGSLVTFTTENSIKWKPENVRLLEVFDLNVNVFLDAAWMPDNRSVVLQQFISLMQEELKLIANE